MKIKKTFLILLSVLLLTGCLPSKSVEENAIVQIVGYDVGEDERIQGTVSIPQYGKSEDKQAASELYLTVDADSTKDVEVEIQKQSSKPISIGKLAVTLYSKELAETDLGDIVDVLSRDPRLSRNMFLGIVEGSSRELIESGFTQDETTSKHLQGLIENNTRHNFPSTSLHDFLYAYYAEGMDPFLPMLKKRESFVELSGVAFFKKGMLVAEVPDTKIFTFKMLKENFTRGMQDLPFEGGTIMMDNIGSKVDYNISGPMDNPTFDIKISLKAEVNEMAGVDRNASPQLAKEMEDKFVEYFNKETAELISLFKEKGIDPLGIGNFTKTRRKDFDLTKWQGHYADLEVNVIVDVQITEYGIFS
ncbi:Ger(x)C family spore germination protein [Halobacillus sp. Nhm2S1]|uniref:Ger(x)C family spore germination protein n=1 Tax=Halobacillus sp. Nhm2S1 TaxID=2866716 RepID=UPI001C72BE85|nr:Ger(x)C family spore germination protein [Halobacillus sp. Nhm2S1]MBX0358297.1 Ger(x)C family spore germination protein [Halobacillus sp. Nhm2S1]